MRNQERLQGCRALVVEGGTDDKRKELENMTVEITLAVAVSIVSLCFSVYLGLKGNQRTDSKEAEARVAEMARVNVKLDSISKDLQDLKDEVRMSRQEVQNLSERVAKVEASASQAHKRLDRWERERGEGGNSHE